MTIEEYSKEEARLLHAVQTGVAHELEFDDKSAAPKHLRVGVNNALCQIAALTRVLVLKGVITEDEFLRHSSHCPAERGEGLRGTS